MNVKQSGMIQSVQRALTLLSLFTPARPVWSVGELARASGLHKSVVTRLMATLAQQAFVVQHPISREYRIGPQAFVVGRAYEPYHSLHQVIHPLVAELVKQSRHSVCVGVPAGKRFVIVDALESSKQLRVAFAIGDQPQYHGAAIGKVLLASMSDAEVLRVVGSNPLPSNTPLTVRDSGMLLEELSQIRHQGFAVSREESIEGVGAVAAPVINAHGSTVAGIAVAYPIHTVDENELKSLIDLSKHYAAIASELVGALELPDAT